MEKIKESDIWEDLNLMKIKRGDVVQNLGSGESYVITNTSPTIAVRTIQISNPSEWRVLKP